LRARTLGEQTVGRSVQFIGGRERWGIVVRGREASLQSRETYLPGCAA